MQHSRLERLVQHGRLSESAWNPRPITPAGRVKMTLAPPKEIDADWFDQHYRASWSDVRALSDQDLQRALEFAGKRPRGDRPADEHQLFDLLKRPSRPQPQPKPPAWSELSPEAQRDAIDDVIASYGEAGRHISRQLAIKLAKSLYRNV